MEDLHAISYFSRSFLNRQVDLPIRSSDMGLLILISERGSITPLDVSHYFNVSKPMVAAMVKRMVKHAYVTKAIDQTDKRSYQLKLNPRGRSLVKASKEKYIAYVQALKEGMGQDKYDDLIKNLSFANQIIKEIT